jgi:MoxR-like ATPase
VITSNRTRELSDALKRRCLYHYVEYPTPEKEIAILGRRVPGLSAQFAREIVALVQRLRQEPELAKRPGVAETLDWAAALLALHRTSIDVETLAETLGLLVKDADDLRLFTTPRLAALRGTP